MATPVRQPFDRAIHGSPGLRHRPRPPCANSAAITRSSPVRGSAHLDRDLGLGSLERVELLVRLDREFGVSLPDRVVAEADTLDDLIAALAGQRFRGSERGAWGEPGGHPETTRRRTQVAGSAILPRRLWHPRKLGRTYSGIARGADVRSHSPDSPGRRLNRPSAFPSESRTQAHKTSAAELARRGFISATPSR